MSATLSILGIYNQDKSIFEGFTVPIGVDKEAIIFNILIESAELEVLYPEPTFLKFAITQWSKIQLPKWEKLEKTLHYEYNPIHNYDRVETYTGSDTNSESVSGKNNTTNSGSSTNSGDDVSQTSQTAFDKNVFKDVSRETMKHGLKNTVAGNSSDTFSNSTDGNGTHEHTITAKGNIGITSTQDMIKQERDVSEFSIYEYIKDAFIHRFCLLVY